MSIDRTPDPGTGSDTPPASPQRLFLREPGWRIGLKNGSAREFCFMAAPGQDYYHRLQDGEIFVFHGDERLCLACAERRGLLAHEPRSLRQPMLAGELEGATLTHPSDYDLGTLDAPGPLT